MNPSTTSAPASGIRKVSLGGLKKKAADKPAGKTYPQMPDPDGTISKLAGDIRREKELYESLEGSIKAKSQELKTLVGPYFFSINAGKVEIPSSVRCSIRKRHDLPHDASLHEKYTEDMLTDPYADSEAGAILLTYVNKYPVADESAITGAIGEANAALYFRQKFLLEVDGDRIPAEKATEVIEELQAVLEKYGCAEALAATEKVVPIETFHVARHTSLDSQQNAALESILPCQTQIKTKNIK